MRGKTLRFFLKPTYGRRSPLLRSDFDDDVHRDWAIAFKRVTSATNWRTMVACVVPDTLAISYTLYLLEVAEAAQASQHCLLGTLNSFAYDYFVRQKTMQPSLPIGPVYETVVPPPQSFDTPAPWSGDVPLREWMAPRVAELICVSNDLTPFALATLGRPVVFKWIPARRETLQLELDAMAFHHFGLSRAEVEHVLATFPKVREYDERAHGEYRSKRIILEIYDAMSDAARTGRPYATLLDPVPADPQVAHASWAVGFDITKIPAIVPTLSSEDEAALTVWAMLHASGGTIRRIDLARAFALRSQPEVLASLAGAEPRRSDTGMARQGREQNSAFWVARRSNQGSERARRHQARNRYCVTCGRSERARAPHQKIKLMLGSSSKHGLHFRYLPRCRRMASGQWRLGYPATIASFSKRESPENAASTTRRRSTAADSAGC